MDNKAQWSLVAAAWVLAIGVIAIGLYAIRHMGGPSAPPSAAQPAQAAAGGKTLCPVDHVEVQVGPDTPRVNYQGTTYYFCATKDSMGRTHKELFLMDPQLYLSGVSSYASPVPSLATPTPVESVVPTATSTDVPTMTRTLTPALH
jgi:YHS domain-containing protein